MKKILVIGSLNIDMVIDVDHMPVAGETILADGMRIIPGGKGANQAFAAGKLGASVTMFGALGDDHYGEIEKNSLNAAGVDTSRILIRKNMSTGLAWITVDKDGDNSIIVVGGANKTLSIQDIAANEDLIQNSDIIVLQLEIDRSAVLYAAKCAKKCGKTVILDPAPMPPDFPEELYKYVDILKPNETELALLSGKDSADYKAATDKLRKKGLETVIVTLGAAGVFINSEKTGKCYIPAIPVQAVDSTAAGDSFTAALAVRIAKGDTLLSAVQYANRVASIVVTKKGAQTSIPSADEVDFDNH